MIDVFRIQPNAPQNSTTIVNQHDHSIIRSNMLDMINRYVVLKFKYPQVIVYSIRE